ncbi:MAG: YcjX family protein [Hyphomicrobiaceae bacterium]|nr:YcjX family protein [Hyphomicrobiaceae bacterium]
MRLPELAGEARLPLLRAQSYVSDLMTPTVRLGVTGLSRAGKTVFITALVRCLTEGGAVPTFGRLSGIAGFRAYLEPQPDDDIPRFQYEEHLAALTGAQPRWPESTRRISQLRLTLEWPAAEGMLGLLGLTRRVHIDIVDYPGEWLIDLKLMSESYAEWSADALALARSPSLEAVARPFLAFVGSLEPEAAADEQTAIKGARLFTDYLVRARREAPWQSALGPGRFLLPGDLEGSPQLTFFPLPLEAGQTKHARSLHGLLSRRFESYKSNIVEPFFKAHFSRLDRQIVLVDALSALNGGAEALANLERGLAGVLSAFRPGASSWLSLFLPPRIDRIVFAATKADHIHRTSHPRLEAILEKATTRAAHKAKSAGAGIRCIATAALRSTEDVEKKQAGQSYRCVRGVAMAGETVDGRRFDGKARVVVFPGDLPLDPLDAFEPEAARSDHYSFVRFEPPVLRSGGDSTTPSWPHTGLDRVVAFLIGDLLP